LPLPPLQSLVLPECASDEPGRRRITETRKRNRQIV
jgi:hypothetical protein